MNVVASFAYVKQKGCQPLTSKASEGDIRYTYSKYDSSQERLYRFMQWQDPGQTILFDKRHNCFVDKALDDAEFQTHTQQAAGDERSIFSKGVPTHDRYGGRLQKSIKGIGSWADWNECVGIQGTLGDGVVREGGERSCGPGG